MTRYPGNMEPSCGRLQPTEGVYYDTRFAPTGSCIREHVLVPSLVLTDSSTEAVLRLRLRDSWRPDLSSKRLKESFMDDPSEAFIWSRVLFL